MANFSLSDSNFAILAALGKISWATPARALGHNPVISTGTLPEDIWTGGGIYPWPIIGTDFQLGYPSGGDTGRVFRVTGIDFATRYEISENVTTNGLTFVNLLNKFYRINSIRNLSPGVNPDDLILRRTSDQTVQAIVPSGQGVTQQSQYTTSRGKTLLIKTIELTINSVSGTSVRNVDAVTYFQSSSGAIVIPRRITAISTNGPTVLVAETYISVPAETDFQLRAIDVSTNNSLVTGAWEGFLISD